jgi:hypothetical protein
MVQDKTDLIEAYSMKLKKRNVNHLNQITYLPWIDGNGRLEFVLTGFSLVLFCKDLI